MEVETIAIGDGRMSGAMSEPRAPPAEAAADVSPTAKPSQLAANWLQVNFAGWSIPQGLYSVNRPVVRRS